MATYIQKPREVEAITFDELVEYGKANGAYLVNGMPQSFEYKGVPITHENDECYLVNTVLCTERFTPSKMLVTDVNGRLNVLDINFFKVTYEAK